MFKSALKKIAHALNSGSIPYIIIGGQAVLLYGEPRLTRDIDVTLGVDIDKLETVLTLLSQTGFMPIPKDVKQFVKETNVLPLEDNSTGIRVDCIFSFSPYENNAIKRAQWIDIDGIPVAYASVEDLIIHKMFAGRPRDLEDVKGIILRNKNLDQKYIIEWLNSFSLIVDRDLAEKFILIMK